MRRPLIILSLIALFASSCVRSAPAPSWTPVATSANPGQPTIPPVATYLPPTRAPGTPISSPTADAAGIAPTFTPLHGASPLHGTPPSGGASPLPPGNTQTSSTATAGPGNYTVQKGDYPGSIAAQFNITVDELLTANSLTRDSIIYPGDVLVIPGTNNQAQQQTPVIVTPVPQLASSDFFKIIPDSELVYGPLSSLLDVEAFIQKQGGYLAYFTQEVDGETLTGAQIVEKVAKNYSVNPRLLLAVLEYRSQWVTNPNPSSTSETPIGYVDNFYVGFYRQMAWTANALSAGFYRWRENKVTEWKLSDETTVVPQPGINAGTAGVQGFFAHFDDNATWQIDTGVNGLFATYSKMFGYPFDLAIEPLLPAGLSQPVLALPFAAGETWQFTGGPHRGWDDGAAWAALDFAPPGEPIGCAQTDYWVTAAAPGLILRAKNGAVVEDLDGDGLEQTGWTILYMHIEERERITPGQYVQTGQKIGHPSCEGGQADATHIHFARRYNGIWIAADDPNIPLVLDGYVTTGNGTEYDGWLTRGDTIIEAWNGQNTINQITP